MASKSDRAQTTGDETQLTAEEAAQNMTGGEEGYVADMGEINISTDFNATDEFKPSPLIPRGLYKGNTIAVKFDPEEQTINWTVCLQDNGSLMSDGVTPVDGVTIEYKNWLPKLGDENEMTRNGKQNKRQAKINMLKEFNDKMKIKANTKAEIVNGLMSGEWVGLAVICTIGTREYNGRIFNELKEMKSAA